jgi:hypothetical protein
MPQVTVGARWDPLVAAVAWTQHGPAWPRACRAGCCLPCSAGRVGRSAGSLTAAEAAMEDDADSDHAAGAEDVEQCATGARERARLAKR